MKEFFASVRFTQAFKQFVTVLLLILNFTAFYAQKNIDTTLIKYQNFFTFDQETIYTQLNKSVYFKGEELWFKTYIYNTKKELPFLTTTNLRATVFNSEGKPVISKIFYADSGTSYGNFEIDSTFNPGLYYLKTTTRYMNNFENDRSYITHFIIEDARKNQSLQTTTYDLQLLPEGGHLVYEVDNTIGIKITDNYGNSTEIVKGEVTDEKGDTVNTFKSNSFGLSSFKLTPPSGKKYKVFATLKNGETITKNIENIEPIGIAMHIENLSFDYAYVSIQTNKATLKNIEEQEYLLLLHKEGQTKGIPVIFEEDKLVYNSAFEREDLFTGINIFTLIDPEGQPLLERIIYNSYQPKIGHIEIGKTERTNDSITIELNPVYKDVTHLNMSISVLPSETKAYDFDRNIVSTFLLSPYIKGYIENPKYYFENTNRKKLYELDLLLLTQGWSSYNWNTIFNYKPTELQLHESGFDIEGELTNFSYNEENNLIIYSSGSALITEAIIDSTNHFTLKNALIFDESDLNFTLNNKRDKNRFPKIRYNITPVKEAAIPLSLAELQQQNVSKFTSIEVPNLLSPDSLNSFIGKAIKLDDVTVSAKKDEREPIHHPLGMINPKVVKPNNGNNFKYLTEVLRQNGFDVVYHGITVTIFSRRIISFSRTPPPPMIFLDYMPITDNSVIANMTMSNIEEIHISHMTNFYGSRGVGGVIHIFRKYGGSGKIQRIFNEYKATNGFSVQKEYYSPEYNKSAYFYDNYAALNWIPNAISDENGSCTIKIPNYNQPVNLYIEGMDDFGNLISQILTIEPQL